MKVTKWWKKLAAAIVAAGIWVPSAAYAVNIPVGDPSFETYVVPSRGYAYATGSLGTYRPASPWIDDQDFNLPPDYVQDDAKSNWLYNTAYANANGRGTPRTGDQAMHGFAHYSSQELASVFEAGKTYTLSVWAQNSVNPRAFPMGVFMYLFDGNVTFSDANALSKGLYTSINQRTAGMTPEQSQANWSQITLTHTVQPGAPEIGHPIGVGFFLRRGTAIEDVTLSAVPEPASVILVGLGGLSLLGLRRRR